eukprot:5944902-Alexandrium_andersonii.AAC.2
MPRSEQLQNCIRMMLLGALVNPQPDDVAGPLDSSSGPLDSSSSSFSSSSWGSEGQSETAAIATRLPGPPPLPLPLPSSVCIGVPSGSQAFKSDKGLRILET